MTANHWTGFYMITASVMKELSNDVNIKVNFQKMQIPLYIFYSKIFWDFAEGCIEKLVQLCYEKRAQQVPFFQDILGDTRKLGKAANLFFSYNVTEKTNF